MGQKTFMAISGVQQSRGKNVPACCPNKFIIYANLGAYELMNFIKSIKANEKSEADVHGA